MTPEQKKKILAKAKIYQQGGKEALKLANELEAMASKIEEIKKMEGPQGVEGKMGPAGKTITGPRGPKGDQGEAGKDGKSITGPTGRDGKQGPMGPAGPAGKDGKTIEGPAGRDGQDGSPDTPEDIKAKILKMGGEAWIPASMIKDLPVMVRELPRLSIFGQGGSSLGGARMEVVANGVSLGQDIRKINFTGSGFTSGVRQSDGVVTLTFTGGTGTVTGPVSSTNNDIVLWNGTGGTVIKDSGVRILNISGTYYVAFPDAAVSSNSRGADGVLSGGIGDGTGGGGNFTFLGGDGGTNAQGGDITFQSGAAGGGNNNGGSIYLLPGTKAGSGVEGQVFIKNRTSSLSAVFDTSAIASSQKTFTFPNASGTFALQGLAGTKVYYVSDTSGGAVTRKLTFTNGILTAET